MSKRSKLLKAKETMRGYLELKMEEEDWHGVADAAMDLRELEIELKNHPAGAVSMFGGLSPEPRETSDFRMERY